MRFNQNTRKQEFVIFLLRNLKHRIINPDNDQDSDPDGPYGVTENGIFVGQIRTRLGIKGKEKTGPLEAAKALISYLRKTHQ